jgi:hypothetical protein
VHDLGGQHGVVEGEEDALVRGNGEPVSGAPWPGRVVRVAVAVGSRYSRIDFMEESGCGDST